MVDTLYLQTENFSVNQLQKFTRIKANHLQPNANIFLGFLTPDNDKPVYGIHAVAIQAGIKDHRSTIHFEITTKDMRKFLTVKISSLPRLLYAHNLFPFDEPVEFQDAISVVKSYADEYGISVLSWGELLVTRIDLAFAMQTHERVSRYIALISEVQMKGYVKVLYPSGVEFRAKNRVYSFYDKYDQMKSVYEKLGDAYFPMIPPPDFPEFSLEELRHHLFRVELKFKGVSSIKNKFKSKLHWSDIEQNIPLLRQVFHAEVIKFISKIEIHDPEFKGKEHSKNAIVQPSESSNIPTTQHHLEMLLERFIRKYSAEEKGNWYPGLMKVIGEHYSNLILGSKFMDLIQEIILKDEQININHASKIQQISRIRISRKKHLDKYSHSLNASPPSPKKVNLKNELVDQLRFYSYDTYSGPLDSEEPGTQRINFQFATFLNGSELETWIKSELEKSLQMDAAGLMNLTDDLSTDLAEVLNSFATSNHDSTMQRPTISKDIIFLIRNQFPTRMKLPIRFVSAKANKNISHRALNSEL